MTDKVNIRTKFRNQEHLEHVAAKMVGVERHVYKEVGVTEEGDRWVLSVHVSVDMLPDVARNLRIAIYETEVNDA